MPYLYIRHKVEDYDAWRPHFDDHDKARKEASSQGGWLFRSHEDPNDITMLIEVADLAKAKALVADPDLKAVMQRAGVVGPPEVALLEKLDDLPY